LNIPDLYISARTSIDYKPNVGNGNVYRKELVCMDPYLMGQKCFRCADIFEISKAPEVELFAVDTNPLSKFTGTTNFNDSVFRFLTIDVGEFFNNYYFSDMLHINNFITFNDYHLMCRYLKPSLDFNCYYYSDCLLKINAPQNIESFISNKEVTLYIKEINNKIPNFTSVKGVIKLDTSIYNFSTYVNKYKSIWVQLYGPERGEVADIQVDIFNFTPIDTNWTIEMDVVYKYVDENVEAEDVSKPDKMSMPNISMMGMEPVFGQSTRVKKEKENICDAIYKQLDYAGFEYELERDDKLLFGNYVYKILKELYGPHLEDRTSMFIANRLVSDLDLFSNNVIDVQESLVEKDKAKEFDMSNFKLTSDDFGGGIAQDALDDINKDIKEKVEKTKEIVNVSSIDELIKKYPDLKEEIKYYLDKLNVIQDTYVWSNTPFRTPIDGVLFKQLPVRQDFAIIPKETGENDD